MEEEPLKRDARKSLDVAPKGAGLDASEPLNGQELSLAWEKKLRNAQPKNLQEAVTKLVELYRASNDKQRGTALALSLESLLDDPLGVSHEHYEPTMKVLSVTKQKVPGFSDHTDYIKTMGRVTKKLCPKGIWSEVVSLGIMLLARDPSVPTTVKKRLQSLVDEDDLEAIVSQLFRSFRRTVVRCFKA